MSDQGFTQPSLEQIAIRNKRLQFRVTAAGNTTAASITVTSQGAPGVTIYTALNSLSAPAAANFSGLTNTSAPVNVGFAIDVGGRALMLKGVDVKPNTIRSASMSAAVITNTGSASAIIGRTGVGTDGNLYFMCSCSGLDLDAQIANHEFDVDLTFDAF